MTLTRSVSETVIKTLSFYLSWITKQNNNVYLVLVPMPGLRHPCSGSCLSKEQLFLCFVTLNLKRRKRNVC